MLLEIFIVTPTHPKSLGLHIHSLVPARQQLRVFQLLQKPHQSDPFKPIFHLRLVHFLHQQARWRLRKHHHSRWKALRLRLLVRFLFSRILGIASRLLAPHQIIPLPRMQMLQRWPVLLRRPKAPLPVYSKLRRVPARCVPQSMLPGEFIDNFFP